MHVYIVLFSLFFFFGKLCVRTEINFVDWLILVSNKRVHYYYYYYHHPVFQTSAGIILPSLLPNKCHPGLLTVWHLQQSFHCLYGHHHPPAVMWLLDCQECIWQIVGGPSVVESSGRRWKKPLGIWVKEADTQSEHGGQCWFTDLLARTHRVPHFLGHFRVQYHLLAED